MTTYNVKLERREEVADGTMTFHFTKPADFSFKPGQAIDLILTDQSLNADTDRHTFSVVSAPFQNELVVATRMRDSAYKRVLRHLAIGTAAKIEGPFGSLTLHNNRTRPAVFIAGGIGITPFMSILRQTEKDQLPYRLALLYSNRRPQHAAFLKELQEFETRNKDFTLIAAMTEENRSNSQWNGPIGLIDDALIKSVNVDLENPIYYLVGPPGMVEAMRETLNRIEVNDDDIRSEDFYGY